MLRSGSVWNSSLPLLLRSCVRCVSYVQGQSPSPKTREYFYYIDHQGQLFLDDARVKNFITCFKDKKFLAFFFRRVKKNTSGRYAEEFPYISPCGPETNYIRCDDLPVVFTHLLDHNGQPIQDIETYGNSHPGDENPSPDLNFNPLRTTAPSPNSSSSTQHNSSALSHPPQSLDESRSINIITTNLSHNTSTTSSSQTCTEVLSYGGAGDSLCVPFQPEKLCMLPEGGRVYHAGPDKLEGVGLVKSSLAIELSRFFVYEEGACSESSSPVGFRWRGRTWTIDGLTVRSLRELKMVET